MRYIVTYEIMPEVFSQHAIDQIITRRSNIEADPNGNIHAQLIQELRKTETKVYITEYVMDDEDDVMIIADYFC